MKTSFLAILLLFSGGIFAQDSYIVTVIKGGVSHANGKPLEAGATLQLTDPIRFSTKESLLIALNPALGRVVLSAKNARPDKEHTYIATIRDYLKMEAKQVRLSTNEIHIPEPGIKGVFEADPSINPNILFIDSLHISIPLSGELTPDDATSYFYLQVPGKTPKIRKLYATAAFFSITRNDLVYCSANGTGNGRVNLNYLYTDASGKKNRTQLAAFTAVCIDTKTCIRVINAVKNTLGNEREEAIFAEVLKQLYYAYGKPDKKQVKEIYDSLK